MKRSIAARVSAAAVPFLIFSAQIDGAREQIPRFEAAPCPVEPKEGERIECGVLVVPENRARPNTRIIRLPVMIFRSRSTTPAPDPLLFMAGGPGGSSVAGRHSGADLPFLDARDFIVLEQRGARFAQPSLNCPATNALKREVSAGRLHGQPRIDALTTAAAECAGTLRQAGVDLDGYTTAALPAAFHVAVQYVHAFGRSVVLGIGHDGAAHLYRHQKEALRHAHRAVFRVLASRRAARFALSRRRVPLSPLLGRE